MNKMLVLGSLNTSKPMFCCVCVCDCVCGRRIYSVFPMNFLLANIIQCLLGVPSAR